MGKCVGKRKSASNHCQIRCMAVLRMGGESEEENARRGARILSGGPGDKGKGNKSVMDTQEFAKKGKRCDRVFIKFRQGFQENTGVTLHNLLHTVLLKI